ncbi:RNA-3-phosphate cyclase [Mitsuokella sp.]|uniref:RNA-3-phosphate cyclase n=1 Tax=Mitsuokella sp. TaxID=2049034 RepID=UPI002A811A75|nr:RNA-3-phosphate cyclase [Mitsuokella sp.]MDY4473757.1 RNA-3-phosphate cyclase [Mitsuokella sp.]
MVPDVMGRPLDEAEHMLAAAGCAWKTEITRPSRDFFKTDEHCLYVVRQRDLPQGIIMLTLAAKQRKEAK